MTLSLPSESLSVEAADVAVAPEASSSRLLSLSASAASRSASSADALFNPTRRGGPSFGSSANSASSPSGYAFDAAGRLSSITDANFGVTRFSYDDFGNLAGLQDAVQNDTAWTYDDQGRVTQETNELGDSRNYVYDAAGDLLRYIDANGAVRQYVYDAAHRVVGETWYASLADADAGQNALNEIAYAYDSAGRIVYEADNYASLAYAYNDAGQIVSTTTASAATPTVTIEYEYDASGRRTQMATTIDGVCDFVEDYVYDSAGRVVLVTQHGVEGGNPVAEKQLSLAYNDDGLLASIDRYLDGSLAVAADYSYDSLGRLVGLVYHQGDVVLASYAWTYSEATGDSGQATVGQVDSSTSWAPNGGLPSDVAEQGMLPVYDTSDVVDALMSGGYDALSLLVSCTSSDGTVTYGYDPTGQLVSADYSDDSLADESYTYDANGNRLGATAGSSSSAYVIGPDNRLLSDGTYWYEYDAEGNRTARFIDVNANAILDSGDTDITEYAWDARNRLVEVIDRATYGGDPTQVVDYLYDLENRWIGRDIDLEGDGVIDRQTRFVYDGNQIVLQFERDLSGDTGCSSASALTASDLTHRYLWQPDAVDQLMADEQVADIEEPGDVLFALTDHLGTVRDLAAYDPATGETTVTNHITYDSYGQKLAESNAAVDCLFGFTGRAFDDETGLQNNLNRWYDAKLGRWMSKDPISFEGRDANEYRYVVNSPTYFTDPSGLQEIQNEFFRVRIDEISISNPRWSLITISDESLDIPLSAAPPWGKLKRAATKTGLTYLSQSLALPMGPPQVGGMKAPSWGKIIETEFMGISAAVKTVFKAVKLTIQVDYKYTAYHITPPGQPYGPLWNMSGSFDFTYLAHIPQNCADGLDALNVARAVTDKIDSMLKKGDFIKSVQQLIIQKFKSHYGRNAVIQFVQ